MNNSRNIRKFERFLFKGIPEQPEPVWERNDNSNVTMRQTGRSQANGIVQSSTPENIAIGFFTFDPEKETESYTSLI